MRERFLGGTRSTESVKQICPYLGLVHDQFSHLPEPSSEHRCYLYMQRERIDRSHQQRFCLTPNYPGCPWLLVSAASEGAGRPARPWQRLGETLRERFDELERVTMRHRWPRALAMLALLLAQAIIRGGAELGRAAWPVVRAFAIQVWLLLLVAFGRTRALVTRWVAQRRLAWSQASRDRARPSLPDTLAPPATATVEVVGEQPMVPPNGVEGVGSSIGVAVSLDRDDGQSSAPVIARPVTKWECLSCFTFNLPSATFCQRCGRLSVAVEQELLAREDFFTLDGLKALVKGDEEAAHRYFVLATQANPQSELAWRWRSRTALTLSDVIDSLEQMLAAIPTSAEAQRDLEIARTRREQEQVLAAARALAQQAAPVPAGPSLVQRIVVVARRLALELASIPSFALGLFWLGQPVLDGLASIGVRGLEPIFPVFRLPQLTLALPPDLFQPLFSSPVNLTDVAPIVLAIWYFLLAFRVADGSATARYVAMVSGLLSLAGTRFVVANGQVFLLTSAALLILSAIGQGSSRLVEKS